MATLTQHQTLFDKIQRLSPEKVAEVEDFVDFLAERAEERRLVRDFMRLSEKSLLRVWDNPDDAAYDDL